MCALATTVFLTATHARLYFQPNWLSLSDTTHFWNRTSSWKQPTTMLLRTTNIGGTVQRLAGSPQLISVIQRSTTPRLGPILGMPLRSGQLTYTTMGQTGSRCGLASHRVRRRSSWQETRLPRDTRDGGSQPTRRVETALCRTAERSPRWSGQDYPKPGHRRTRTLRGPGPDRDRCLRAEQIPAVWPMRRRSIRSSLWWTTDRGTSW